VTRLFVIPTKLGSLSYSDLAIPGKTSGPNRNFGIIWRMLSLEAFLFLGSTLLACVWWACIKDDPDRTN
jgi:hypothetical protein